MHLVINGDPHDLPGPLSVSALLAHLAIDPRRVAVEVNEMVIKKARYDETRVEPDDRVEIVNFVGGG
jgi:thiamine biosynthesis protein ThiS